MANDTTPTPADQYNEALCGIERAKALALAIQHESEDGDSLAPLFAVLDRELDEVDKILETNRQWGGYVPAPDLHEQTVAEIREEYPGADEREVRLRVAIRELTVMTADEEQAVSTSGSARRCSHERPGPANPLAARVPVLLDRKRLLDRLPSGLPRGGARARAVNPVPELGTLRGRFRAAPLFPRTLV